MRRSRPGVAADEFGAGACVEQFVVQPAEGPLQVELSGKPLRFEGLKQRRLFVLLAMRAPDPVSGDELLEALWVTSVPPVGRRSLGTP